MTSIAFANTFSAAMYTGISILCLAHLARTYRTACTEHRSALWYFFPIGAVLTLVAVAGIVVPLPSESAYTVWRQVAVRGALIFAHLLLVVAANRVADAGDAR